ncbi:MAG: hypothetical protein ACJ8LG_08800 [Massilia sp.]
MPVSSSIKTGAQADVARRALGAALVALCAGCGGGSGSNGSGDATVGAPPRIAAISVVAGDAMAEGSTDGPGATARFGSPRGIAVDADGNLYVADRRNCTIRKITPSGQVSTLAGSPGVQGQVDDTGSAARFMSPGGLSIDAAGNLFVADDLNIRKVSPSGVVTTVTTLPVGASVDTRSMGLFVAGATAVAANGDLYVTNGIGTRKISAAGTTMVEGVATADNMFGTKIVQARGITIDKSGTVYVADLQNVISKIGTDGKLVAVAGSPGVVGSADGSGASASFSGVSALATDANGNVYAADSGNNLIRKITPAGVVTTVAGTRGSFALQPGPAPGSLAPVGGVTVDKGGNLFATSGTAVIKVSPP